MSWSDGTGLFGELAYILRKTVPDLDSRREIYEHMLESFVDCDWEGYYEHKDLIGSDPVLDEVLGEFFKAEEEDEEDPEEDE